MKCFCFLKKPNSTTKAATGIAEIKQAMIAKAKLNLDMTPQTNGMYE